MVQMTAKRGRLAEVDRSSNGMQLLYLRKLSKNLEASISYIYLMTKTFIAPLIVQFENAAFGYFEAEYSVFGMHKEFTVAYLLLVTQSTICALLI